jgi:tRNA-dihydrouridine synthase
MRAGWNDDERNAPTLARMVEDAGAAAVAVHGRTAAQSYSGRADWDLVASIADLLRIPVFGSGDCVEPEQVVARLGAGVEGVLVGRGVLRNPWILAQTAEINGLAILTEDTPEIDRYYSRQVVTGFVLPVDESGDFHSALKRKLFYEVAGAGPDAEHDVMAQTSRR